MRRDLRLFVCILLASPACTRNAVSEHEPEQQARAAPVAAEAPAVSTVTSDEQLAPIPSMPISQLLGRTREHVETLFSPVGPEADAGWARYNRHLVVRYEDDILVEMVQRVPGELTCLEAARWMGFGSAQPPIRRADRCVWPPESQRHRLGDGVSGELILDGGHFRARVDG